MFSYGRGSPVGFGGMDLSDAEGELGARRLHHVLEVHEDALQKSPLVNFIGLA